MGFVGAAAFGLAQVGANCVDGVTPDCSDAAVCAPSTDSGSSSEASVVLPEASSGDTGAPADGSDGDAADGDADASNG